MDYPPASPHQTPPHCRKANRVSQLIEYYQNLSTSLPSTPKTPVKKKLIIEPGPSSAASLVKRPTTPSEALETELPQSDSHSTAVPSPLFSKKARERPRKMLPTSSAQDFTITIPITVTLLAKAYYKNCRE
ncbi:hypothetical protein COCCADRAFT_27942 [Bipolaris zeicola 26-R-13]|uniref:Uncharacterized protein n=1 Tax=Cochliobolus carbonum (strain 26-R-13) TaxID=930089 RepID=W6YJ54_COCC2|nr:uncharacterized protein COCCADRAFT_27942 [Bipolaris zeicola 26-R-13]EUC31326.1 hypothetical protein COCCADRAFT_27942 [Bipolaris zeicola 26-R-13]